MSIRRQFKNSLVSAAKSRSTLQKVLWKPAKISTSTPIHSRRKAIMESMTFSKSDSYTGSHIDSDSGYMSLHNRESNSDYSVGSETTTSTTSSATSSKPIYLSEDALLETPEISCVKKFDFNETRTMFSGPDSMVNPSVASEKTNLSGFSINDSTISTEVTAADEIIYKLSETINCSSDMEMCSSLETSRIISPKPLNPAIVNLGGGTPLKQYNNQIDPNFSPDLFEEPVVVKPSAVAEEQYINRKDRRILKRVQLGLSGLPPPPSITIIQMSVGEMLGKIQENQQFLWTNSTGGAVGEPKSLLVNVEKLVPKPWPRILEDRYHGLHYNRSKLSEEFEQLCDKFAKRCVGAETQSTCTIFENTYTSPTKRKSIKQRWASKSPGRRLSHLARRRITFSSANLQNGSSSVSRTRQILVDAKKLELLKMRKSPRKTPKKTPGGKSPRKKTPSSSAKKKLALRFRKLTGEIQRTLPSTSTADPGSVSSKRALFQSPDSSSNNSSLFNMNSSSALFDGSSAAKKLPPKRALFTSPRKSPRKKSPFKSSPFKGFGNKRKRSDSDEGRPSKLPRSTSCSLELRPSTSEGIGIMRTRSEMTVSRAGANELSAIHKKKLQWAVYEALRTQNIAPTHPQFKLFASILARVTRRFLPNLSANVPRPEGGTSDRMLRIARFHVYAVVKGKSVEEIISEYTKNRLRNQKPQGYISIEEYKNRELHKESVLQDKSNTIESLEKKKLAKLREKPVESRIDRIRKVINFSDNSSR